MKQSTIGWSRRLLVLLVMGVMATLAASAQKTQVGYWTLAFKKVYQEDGTEWGGVKPVNYKAHIINAQDGLAEFQIVHSKPANNNVYDGKWNDYQNTFSVSWSTPEMYVKIGEEDKIAIEFSATVDGKPYDPAILNDYNVPKSPDQAKNNVAKAVSSQVEFCEFELAAAVMPEVTLNNQKIGFSYFQKKLNEITSFNDMNEGLGDAYEDAMMEVCEPNEGEIPLWELYIKDQPSGKLCYDEDKKWSYNLKLGQESYLLVSLTISYKCESIIAVSRNGGKSSTVHVVYLYRNSGQDVDVVTRTDDPTVWGEDGESSGTQLPPWVIPVAVVSVVTPIAYTLMRNRCKNEEDGNPTSESTGGPYSTYQPPVPPVQPRAVPPVPPGPQVIRSQESEQNEKLPSTYRMILYKEFGDSLMVGDEPQLVGARIEEITAKGVKKQRLDLTAQIEIVEGNNITIVEKGMAEEYRAALIKVEELPMKQPWEGDITFVFKGHGGSLRNKVVFNIKSGEIFFGQDNLTLPAGYEKTAELPFVIPGFGEDPKVELSVEKNAYQVELKKKDGLWFAVLNENKNCADFKNKQEPGQYNYYSLHIKATDKNGWEVETDFPICRFQMGLTIDTTYLKCYIEEYNGSKHLSNRYAFDQVVNTTPWNSTDEPKYEVRKMVPAETKCKLRLFEFDEENHQVLRIPAVPDEIRFESVEENRKELVEKLGIDWEPLKHSEEGARPIVFRCIRHGLDAPLRVKAKMIVKTTFNNRKYELEKEVGLHSQPVRQSQNMNDSMGQLKEDERLTDVLIHIQDCIFSHGYLKNLAPLDRYIQTMLDGYDATYGYDNEQMRTVRRIWTSFLQGTFAGANAEAEKVTLGDELMMFFDAFMAKGKEVEDSLGFFSRMALGVFTLGCSEVVFTSMEVVREMKDYVDKGGDSVFGAFCCGVKVVAREYIMEKVSDLGMGMLKKGATKVGLTPENLKAKAQEYYGNITRGRQMKQAISDTKLAKANAKVKVEQAKMHTQNTHLDMEEIKMKKAEIEGLEIGKKKIEKFKEVMDLPDSPKNTKLKNEMAMEIQKDKNAMSLLADYDNTAMNDMRSKFNKQIQDLSDGADYEVMYQMAIDHDIPFNEVKKLNASASSKAKLKNGEKITFDHDATFYHETKTGERTYFNQIETEKMYNKKYYKEYHGQYAVTTETNAAKFAKNADQTVIQSDLHPESYGNENFKILSDANSKTKALADANMVGDAMTYKCNEWYYQGMKELADTKTASAGIAKIREGCRQCYKQYENYLSPRNITRSGVNGGNKIPPEFHAYMRILKEMDVNKGGSVVNAKRELERLGTSFEKVFQQLGDLMREVG